MGHDYEDDHEDEGQVHNNHASMHHYEYDLDSDENDQEHHCKDVDEVDHDENYDNSRKCVCGSGYNNDCE